MIISQDGQFTVGTVGLPVECDLVPLAAGKLTGAVSVKLDLTRPDGTSIAQRTLPFPSCIIDTSGKIEWFSQAGDFTHSGVYTIKLTIDLGGGVLLTLTGDFSVSD